MKTDFAYIDDVVERSTKKEPPVSTKERADAAQQAKKIIGGFRVKDDKAERDNLDAIVARKRSGIEMFLQHRTMAREELGKYGVKPMAIVPTKSWERICYDTGLYIMAPNSQGQIGYEPAGLVPYAKWSEHAITKKAKLEWDWFLDAMFPKRKSLPNINYAHKATLVLPDPPEAVAAILCKAQKLGLKVAAVAEAISFVETPSEIVKRSNVSAKDLWAQARGYADHADWVKRDPIVTAEYGSATAIIAQFGDFPIEKEVVDAVLATYDLLPEGVTPQVATMTPYPSVEEQYRQAVQNGMQQPVSYPQTLGGVGGLYTSNTAAHTYGYASTVPTIVAGGGYVVNSQSWTGR